MSTISSSPDQAGTTAAPIEKPCYNPAQLENRSDAPVKPPQPPTRPKLEHPLSRKKKQAISLLLEGHSDQAVADRLGVHRTTISRWRLYHPTFRTHLNRQRIALWTNHADRLRAMMAQALDTLQAHLASSTERSSFRAAVNIVKLAARIAPPPGPADEYELLKQIHWEHCAERDRYGNQGLPWPVPKEDLDDFREYLLKKAANIPLDGPRCNEPLRREWDMPT